MWEHLPLPQNAQFSFHLIGGGLSLLLLRPGFARPRLPLATLKRRNRGVVPEHGKKAGPRLRAVTNRPRGMEPASWIAGGSRFSSKRKLRSIESASDDELAHQIRRSLLCPYFRCPPRGAHLRAGARETASRCSVPSTSQSDV